MAKVTEKLKLTLPSPEDRIDIDVLNGNYETLENQIYTNLIKKETSISEESSFGEVIPPYVTITNTNLEAVNVTVGEEKVIIPAASTITVAIKEKKELSIDTDGVIAVEYFISNERYASEQSGSAVDSELSEASENPVQNKVITAKFKEYYNSEEVDELIDGIGTPEDVYTKTETDNLLSAKANKSDTYTKTETDNKITEKVSEIVAGAPEDFDTLKEMSDWLTEHEGSAAEMNTAIQQNKTDISSLNTEIAKKVDKVTGKSLIDDTEIERLADVDNYDDTSINTQIADIYNNRIGGKNLFKASDGKTTSNGITTEWKNGVLYVSGTAESTKVTYVAGFPYITTGEQMIIPEDCKATCSYTKYTASVQLHILRATTSHYPNVTNTASINLVKGDRLAGICIKATKGETYDFEARLMMRPNVIKDASYVPYIPTNAELVETIDSNQKENLSSMAINKTTLGAQCKNLLKPSHAKTETKNGVTFTLNDDGTVTLNGTCTAEYNYKYGELQTPGKYRVNGYPEDADISQYRLMGQIIKNDSSTQWFGSVIDQPLTLGSDTGNSKVIIYIKVLADKTYENVVFSPMIRYADVIDTTYEPYTPSLQEQINTLIARIAALEGTATTAE